MTQFLASCGEVLTALIGWCGQVSTLVMAQPVMLVPIALGTACAGIGVFKRLAR